MDVADSGAHPTVPRVPDGEEVTADKLRRGKRQRAELLRGTPDAPSARHRGRGKRTLQGRLTNAEAKGAATEDGRAGKGRTTDRGRSQAKGRPTQGGWVGKPFYL